MEDLSSNQDSGAIKIFEVINYVREKPFHHLTHVAVFKKVTSKHCAILRAF